MHDLTGKTAVVTGSGSGIGRALAHACAREGMRVVVADVEAEAGATVATEIVDAGGTAMAVETDVSDRDAVVRLASETRCSLGTVHLLCNNAGVSLRRRGIHATHEDWLWVLGVNLWGAVHGIEAFLPDMLASGEEGHVVNTCSVASLVPSARSATYSTSKYGLLGLTETLRCELAGTPIGISALCPGAVTTALDDAARNRPSHLAAPTPAPPHAMSWRLQLSSPITPELVAELTLAGVRNDQRYIFTDLRVRDLVEARHRELLADFGRLEAIQRVGDVPDDDPVV